MVPGEPAKSDAVHAEKGLGGDAEGEGEGDAPGDGLRLGVGVRVAAGHVITRSIEPAPPSVTHTSPEASRAIPCGDTNAAQGAAPSRRAGGATGPVPATVVTKPPGKETARTKEAPESATHSVAREESNARPAGEKKDAPLRPGPSERP